MEPDTRNVQRYVGNQIRKHREEKGMTQRELGDLVGVRHNTISAYEAGTNQPEQNKLFKIAEVLGVSIDSLFPEVLGSRQDERSPERLLQWPEEQPLTYTMLPIVGRVSCGNGDLALEDIEGYEPTPRDWVAGGRHFYLRAKGDSMIGARIYDGDLLLIREQPEIESGEIGVVLIDDEAVLKRIYRHGEQLILQPENPTYKPILAPPASARVIGKLKRIIITV